MNQVLIDNTLLLLAGTTALLIVRFTRERKTGFWGAFFLLFAPFVIFYNMWAHTIAVLIVNYKRHLAGSFHFSFSFYGLLLMGIVFIVASGINIHCTRKRIKGDLLQKKNILWLNAGTAVLFLPVMLINPIALLPVLASIVSSVTLLVVRPFNSRLIYTRKDSVPATSPTTLVEIKEPVLSE